MDKESYKGRGGKRDGAGRPATGRTTKTIRVSKDFPSTDELKDILDTLRNWKEISDQSSPTSPRWDKLRQLLSEIPESVFETK
jgi:arsenate reductase-like glutaredoxin family protein